MLFSTSLHVEYFQYRITVGVTNIILLTILFGLFYKSIKYDGLLGTTL